MAEVYKEARAALRPGGRLILVIKDHIRAGRRVPTAELTIGLCEGLGFALEERVRRHLATLSLWQRRRREQGLPVVEEEDLLVFQHADQSGMHPPAYGGPGTGSTLASYRGEG
jgi:hypothetical protein